MTSVKLPIVNERGMMGFRNVLSVLPRMGVIPVDSGIADDFSELSLSFLWLGCDRSKRELIA